MAFSPSDLILASASLRREALLRQAGLSGFRILPADIDETPRKGELPRAYALRMASEKAMSVTNSIGESKSIILAADTVVALGRRILPKPEDDAEAERCLRLLSGRRHQVMTALAAAFPGKKLRTRIVTTRVAFKVLTEAEIAAYLASKEGIGKAGGYAIQGRAEAFVRFINGSYSNVVGLPLAETLALLNGASS